MLVVRRMFLITCLAIAMALTPVTVQPSYAIEKRLPDDLRTLMAQGQPNDELPLIVTLNNPWGLESARATRTAKSQRRAAVRQAQQAFVQRQSGRIRNLKGQTTVTPILFVTATRANIAALYNDDDVVHIALDQATPLAMYDSNQLLGLQVSHEAGYDGSGTSVAVLDTGVLSSHEFLSGQVVAEACFSTNNFYSTSYCPGAVSSSTAVGSGAPCPTTMNGCYHGTHVAGTIAGKAITTSGGISLRGVAPGAKIIAIQVFSFFKSGTSMCSSASGCLASWDSDQIRALDWLYDNASTSAWGTLASVNMSLGGTAKYTSACDSDTRKTYVDQLRTIGVATVIASGNSGFFDGIGSPACISTAIAVGATRLPKYGLTADVVASFSNAPSSANNGVLNANGDRLLDLLGPGQYVYSAMISSTTAYSILSGTSMATPHVAGAWAVLKQVNPSASVAQVLEWLYQSGVTITDSRNSLQLPRISLFAAINAAVGSPVIVVTATNTPTATFTPSRTFTASPTPTASATAMPSSTPTASMSSTPTSTTSATATPSSTPTASATATPSPTPTASATATPSLTITLTRTRTNTPIPRPAAFRKLGPVDRTLHRSLLVTLSWSGSARAQRYEYCIATSGPACTKWVNVGLNRRVVVRGLARNTSYVWQVRAVNATGVTIASDGRWRFTTTR
jgi:subtilisin family serine protease